MTIEALESKDSYTVGWVAALEIEHAAAVAMLDEEHSKPLDFTKPLNDPNSYTWGRIGVHNIVIAVLPAGMYGQSSATATASHMVSSFPQIRVGLLVGIGGGIPRLDDDIDIRLGDVVVSQPSGTNGGVVQYDAGKATAGGEFQLRGFLNSPPLALLNVVSHLKSQHERRDPKIPEIIQDMLAKNRGMAKVKPGRPSYSYQGKEHDRFFKSDYDHQRGKTCNECDASREIERDERQQPDPEIHYGLIASGNVVVKDTAARDEVLRRLGGECLCIETEAAGLMNNFPCLVIRGICDYADSHKNDRWQRYAAATAAAYAKELLGVLDGGDVKGTKRAIEILPEIQRTVNETHSLTKGIRESVERQSVGKHHDAIEKWLSPSQPSNNYHRALRQKHEGSGQWFLQSDAYSAWKTGGNSFLWLNGIPGCGKTILSSTIIKDIMGDNSSVKSVIYFYFDFADDQKQSLESAIRSLASQLYFNCPDARGHLDALFSSCSSGKQQPSIESLCDTFQRMIQQAGEVRIILDALDECSSRTQNPRLLPWLASLRDNCDVHILVTSRPEQDLRSIIEGWDFSEIISLQSDLVKDDIASYVHTEVRESSKLARWHTRPDVQQEIETALSEKANGMFRWVSCQLDVLQNCLDPPAVHNALASLPETLDETYSRILNQLPKDYRPKAKRLLQFLAFSKRPLRVDEAIDALAVDITMTPRFDEKNRMPVPDEISKYCSSLIFVATRKPIYKEPEYFEDRYVSEIRLAHFSVKDYITSERLEKDFAEELREAAARAAIAETCLAYLIEVNWITDHRELRIKYPMAFFAAECWVDHAGVGYKVSHGVKALTKIFFSSHDIYAASFRLCEVESFPHLYEQQLIPLYYISLSGFLACVQDFIDEGTDVNAKGGYFGNALQAASAGGHQDIVQILLKNGADVNTEGGHYSNALLAASVGGHQDIVQILLKNGADINAQNGFYGSALQAASDEGHLDIVQILLKNDADVNTEGVNRRNALQAASANGHQDIVQILLKKGADINAQNGFYGSALQAASAGGYQDIVQILLKNGADVNIQNRYHGNALQAASVLGHQDIVQILLKNGADVNAKGGPYGNALQAASAKGHLDIVQILLKKGAHVNAEGGDFGNALQAALAKGHQIIVQILLKNGAKVNAQ